MANEGTEAQHHERTPMPRSGSVAFLLAGMGDHYAGMGRGLYETEHVFRRAVDHCASVLEPALGTDVRAVLYPGDARKPPPSEGPSGLNLRAMLQRAPRDPSADRLNHTRVAHAAMFVTEYALAALWMSRGVRPRAMIGHSLGEFVAATIAGVFRLDEVLRLIAERSRLIELMPAGAMLALPLSEIDVRPILPPDVVVAAANSPASTVIAGPLSSIDAMEALLSQHGSVFRRLPVHYASHSPMMAAAAADIEGLLRGMTLLPPDVPFISNVSGTWITDSEATDPGYWANHVVAPVRFADGVLELMRSNTDTLLEIGPGATLGTFARQCAAAAGLSEPAVVQSLAHAFERDADPDVLADASRRLESIMPAQSARVEASTAAQVLIVGMWCEVLGLRTIGVHDDFFHLGGSSLTAMRMLALVRDVFEVELPLRVMFQRRTVAGLAEAIEEAIVMEVALLSDDEAESRM